MSYGGLERRVGRLLDRFPGLRRVTKRAYQRANYYLSRRPGDAPATVHPSVHVTRAMAVSDEQEAGYFFGYFGVTPWSRDQRHVVLHRLDASSPKTVQVCMLDAHSRAVLRSWRTPAWTYQQGSMAQWMRRADSEWLIFNDVVDGRLGSRRVTPDGNDEWLEWPVQTAHPQRDEFLAINYRRLSAVGSEYGYDLDVGNLAPDLPLAEDGIWRVPADGAARLIVTLSDLVSRKPHPSMANAQHEVNHLVYAPSGDRFAFMHRWRGRSGRSSRLFVSRADGSAVDLLLDQGMVSHYAWRDDNTLLAWARTREGDRYHLIDASDGHSVVVGRDVLDRYGDGHPSYSPRGRWIVSDSYPDRARRSHLFVYDCSAGRLVELGAFFAPWGYDGARRCDLHPRWSPDGNAISFDSAHEGVRRSYVADISRIVAG